MPLWRLWPTSSALRGEGVTRAPRHFRLFGFTSTHRALDAEALLDDLGIEVVPVPTPKPLGALCGIALRVPIEEADRAETYLVRAAIEPANTLDIVDV